MSYRYRLIKVKKEITAPMGNVDTTDFLRVISKVNPDVSVDDDTLMPYAYEMFNQEEIFDFGSNFKAYKDVIETSTRFFSNDELNDYYADYDIRLCNKDTLLAIIESYRKVVLNNFKELLNASEKDLKNHIEGKIGEWENLSEVLHIEDTFKNKEAEKQYNQAFYPYDISSSNKIVLSWLYEYEIFELVYILKTFDWENYDLLFYGW